MLCCKKKIAWDFLQRRLISLCGRFSAIVASHPYPFIIIPILLSSVLSVGWLYKKDVVNAVYMFTPINCRSESERQSLLDNFPTRDGIYVPGRSIVLTKECEIIVTSKDGGNILRPAQVEAAVRLNQYIMKNISITDGHRNYSYFDLCLNGRSGCNTNSYITFIPQLLGNPLANMSYPTATYDNQQHYLASVLGGVTRDPTSRQIKSAEAWFMTYQLKMNSSEELRLSSLWELEFEKQLYRGYNDSLIKYSFYHSKTLDRELQQNGKVLAPRFMIMFATLLIFALLCTFTFVWRPFGNGSKSRFPWRIDWVLSRPFVALAGLAGAGMGVSSAIGLLSFIGMPYQALVKVMPFLIVAVRLDNTFLMISALENTKRSLPANERIIHAMSEAAVSITITVLTDVLSFACGVLTDFPSVQIFSIYTTLAIIITFFYQLTFLLGILVLSARAEEKGLHSLMPCIKVHPVEQSKGESTLVQLFCLGSASEPFVRDSNHSVRDNSEKSTTPPPPYPGQCTRNHHSSSTLPHRNKWELENHAKNKIPTSASTPELAAVTNKLDDQDAEYSFLHRWIRDVYAPFLLLPITKIAVLTFLVIFWAISAYGCAQVRQGLEPVKLLLDDSYAVAHYRNLENYFWGYGMQLQVGFLQPGNVSDPLVQKQILHIVAEFANAPHAIGMEGVDFWMIAFDQFLRRTEGRQMAQLSTNEFYDKLDYFLSINENAKFLVDLAPPRTVPDNSNITLINEGAKVPITAFRLLVGMRDFSTTMEQTEAIDQFRNITDSYPDFKLVAFNVLSPFVDQYEDILPNVLQEIYCSVAFMIAIALLLIPHPACAIWVTLAIASIDLGVIGFMTLWGLNMDTISMVTIIMSIGFSVDFTAHIAYAYVANIHEKPDDRIKNALGTLGWPVLQGGIATLIGVVVLADLNSYMVVSFFKTVFLVIVFGLLHALVFLPVLLNVSTEPALLRLFRRNSNSSSISKLSSTGRLKKLFSSNVARLLKTGEFDLKSKKHSASADLTFEASENRTRKNLDRIDCNFNNAEIFSTSANFDRRRSLSLTHGVTGDKKSRRYRNLSLRMPNSSTT